jgi:hypothetical protein
LPKDDTGLLEKNNEAVVRSEMPVRAHLKIQTGEKK